MTLTLQSHFNIDTSYKDTKTVHTSEMNITGTLPQA